MKLRDGVPILENREIDYHLTKGCIITFKENQEKTAYEIICSTGLRKLYFWKTITANGKKANILFGANPDEGSNMIEDAHERVCFDGKNDPLFREALELIERNLESDHGWKMESFFELQMNYRLLWSAIDRYSSLKYNKSQSDNLKKFANQKAFRKGIEKYACRRHRPVYSTDDLKIHRFDADDPIGTIFYYYTFRCNVVHRGKAMTDD